MGKDNRKPNVGLQLLINNPGSADPVLPIGWCIAPKTSETIERWKVINPHLLIVVAYAAPNWRYGRETSPDGGSVYDYEEVDRRLVPLKQGLEYVQVNKPGKYRIFATIVGDSYDNAESLRRQFLGKNKPRLVNTIGEFQPPPKPSLRQAMVDVEISNEFFAHEPAQWEKDWVNLWFMNQAKDQCQFRKRRILAYTIQPLCMAVFYLATILFSLGIAAFLFLGGYRNIQWELILKPQECWWRRVNVANSVKVTNSVFLVSKDGKKTRWFLIPAWPYFSFLGAAAMALSQKHFIWTSLLWLYIKSLLWFYGIGLAGFLILLAIYLIVTKLISIPTLESLIASRRARRTAKEIAFVTAALARQHDQLQYLQCTAMTRVPSLKALPHPTIRLRFLALKARVCRPFSY